MLRAAPAYGNGQLRCQSENRTGLRADRRQRSPATMVQNADPVTIN